MKNLRNVLKSKVLLSVALFGISCGSLAQQVWVSCKPIEAAAYAERIHVKCASAVDFRFWYFAASTADARFAARVLSVIEAAQLGDKYVNVLFDVSDTTGTSFGCDEKSCRRLLAAMMVEEAAPPPDYCVFNNKLKGCSGFCAATPDSSCPGYCASHNTSFGCPGYCTTHPTDAGCPAYCTTHPDAVICQAEAEKDHCQKHPHDPHCPAH